MAQPITKITKTLLAEDEQKEKKLEDLKTLLVDNDEALNRVLEIISELNQIGVLEAAESMLQAKEKIAKIALQQVSRKPITNLINTLMGSTGALMNADPQLITKLVSSAMTGMNEANTYLQTKKKIGIRDLVKTLNDPDINRAIGFGIHFLKGMGKELKE